MRNPTDILRTAALGVLLLLLLPGAVFVVMLAMFFFGLNISSDAVARTKSPSGNIEAILEETNGGATTSFGYIVSLRAAPFSTDRIRVASAYGATRNNHAYGMNLVWVDENTLEIQYWRARSAALESPSVSIGGIEIAVRMKAGVLDDISAGRRYAL